MLKCVGYLCIIVLISIIITMQPRTTYPDFTQAKSGLQYKTVKEGTGYVFLYFISLLIANQVFKLLERESPAIGDKVTIDWEGYTIGYYGRPFETRNKVGIIFVITYCHECVFMLLVMLFIANKYASSNFCVYLVLVQSQKVKGGAFDSDGTDFFR